MIVLIVTAHWGEGEVLAGFCVGSSWPFIVVLCQAQDVHLLSSNIVIWTETLPAHNESVDVFCILLCGDNIQHLCL